MEFKLSNEELCVTINSLGAEVTSVIDVRTGKELIWNGDERFWHGHGPVLFPACGGLWNGEYTLNDKTYHMPKHGVVRQMEWSAADTDQPDDAGLPQSIYLQVDANEESRKVYPFNFHLKLRYELDGRHLFCDYDVVNLEDKVIMPFQIGGHPSIMLPDYKEGSTAPIGYLQPTGMIGEIVSSDCLSVVRVGEQGCWCPKRYSVPTTEDGLIPITVDTFANEALIIDHNQIAGMQVLDAQKRPIASVFSQAPVFLVWQPQGLLSPFVCVEPWYGLCDQEGHSTSLIERPYTQCALPQSDRYEILYSIEFPNS